MKKRNFFLRYASIGAVFLVVILVYIVKLINVQITGQDYYKTGKAIVYTERTVPLFAERGEIFDRNGVPLITNEYSCSVCFDAGTFPTDNAEANELVLKTINSGTESGATFERPAALIAKSGDTWRFDCDFSSGKGKRLAKLLAELGLGDDPDAEASAQTLLVKYGIAEKERDERGKVVKDGKTILLYSEDDASLLLDVRLDMALSDFSQKLPYTVLENASVELITELREGRSRGILTKSVAERRYEIPGLASHILGRVGKIQAKDAEYYTEKGYPLDAIVGTSGVELAFEDYLRGRDGTLVIVEDSMGNVVDTYVKEEPIPGQDVYLTLDAKLQALSEQSLSDNIKYIVANALESGKELSGEDADAGAIVVINVKTGEVLALASNPTYNLATFSEDYATLKDDPKTPMLNRALLGTYTPGSTFKVGVAVAALMEGVITPNTIINATGVYRYYEDSGFTPRCWINLNYGGSHGPINVTEAIQVSCNYFFYEVGRLLTISRMNDYCKSYGLGQSTGIELPESTGILAGPDYRAEAGLGAWSPGDTVQAAIGQIENSFTPLQISVYISTLLNRGTRIGAHILKEVREYGSDEPVYTAPVTVMSEKVLSDDAIDLVKNAMKNVTEDTGSAARLFQNYPLSVGGKTGTAQVVSTQSDNAVFTAFAPFDDPEIVATCVIEKGAGGTDAGFSVRDIFSYYFNVEYADGFDDFKAGLREAEAKENQAQGEAGGTNEQN